MTEDLRQLTDEINRRPDQVDASDYDPAEWCDAHMEACAAVDGALSECTDAELIEIVTTQSAERPDPLADHAEDTPAARAAAGILGLRHYSRAQEAHTPQILAELEPLTDYRDPGAVHRRPENYREEITAADAVRREALVSVLTDRHVEARAAAEEYARECFRENDRDRAAAVCRAAQRVSS